MDKNNKINHFDQQTRQYHLQQLKTQNFDCLIIGGGITGAGVVRDMALRGLKVALVESADFASGTSSRSSKLIHGGIRYLENKDFKLVFEALNERNKLLDIAPHLTHPLRFMIPIYSTSRVGMGLMGLGMWLYDILSLFQAPELHERLNTNDSMKRIPIINNKNLLGSYVYSDGYMDDDSLVFETLRSAHQAGAVAVNYCKALKSKVTNNKVEAVLVKDIITGEEFSIKTQHVVSTVGPWTDLVGPKLVSHWSSILRPTKGIHLTFSKDRLKIDTAVVMAAEKSNRIVFAIPRHEMVIVGTTDTDYKADPSTVTVTVDDVDYLLDITNAYFPWAQLTKDDIIGSYAGVRPLVKDPDSDSEGKTSREHTIIQDKSGFTFVAGGKYTTYRKMAEEITDKVIHFFPIEVRAQLKRCETDKPLNEHVSIDLYEQALYQCEEGQIKKTHLTMRYGIEGLDLYKKYDELYNQCQIEAIYAIEKTMCLTIKDFFTTRTRIMLTQKDHGLSELNNIKVIFKIWLGLSDEDLKKQEQDFLNHLKNEFSWKV